MQWTRRGAHLLLQTRTRTLDGTLRPTFERWFPGLAGNNTDSAYSGRSGMTAPHFGMLPYIRDNPKYKGNVEYLFCWNGAETHVVRPGAHDAIV